MSLQRILSRKQDHWKVLFRENVYRPRDMALMARELCALANTDGAGNRYIFFNAMRDMNGDLQFTAAQKGAVNQLETLVEKAGHFLEPKFKLRAVYGDINGKLGIGIELVDFRVKQVEFVDEAKDSVYNRMREERARVAAQTRGEGREQESLTRSTAEKDRTIILADANKQGQIIRGEGDARAAEIYANAYSQDPEFYSFYRSIDAYRNSMGKSGDVLILDPNNEFFKYLNQSDGSQ